MSYSNWSLEKRFTLLSLVTFLILGTAILSGNLWFAKKQLVSAAARYSEAWTNSVLGNNFRIATFHQVQ